MQNISNIIYRYSLCLSLFLLSFSANVKANESPFYHQYQHLIGDAHDKIGILDDFIDAGIHYKELTGKRLDYKKCMKIAYKKIAEIGYHLSKKDKKDFENAFYNRLEQRFSIKGGNKISGSKAYIDPRGPKERESNFKEALGLVAGGVTAQFVPCGATNLLGGVAVVKGLNLFYDEASKCWKDPNHRIDNRERDNSYGNQSQSEKNREKKDHGTFRD